MTNCCEECRLFWACEEKWYRGERHEEDVCCELCHKFYVCNPDEKRNPIERGSRSPTG
ncbi:MAG TPA: hypothetical protein P5287_02905 [bacterium]|nr:hypothetical protein [bacterium]